jgi:PST family polysaccharide transporter
MTEMNFEPRHKEMAHHVMSGIVNSGLIQIVKILCQFGSVVILSRLLRPSDFGIIAMVGPVYGFVLLFQDLGLSQATIQKPGLTHDEVNAFFWINVAVGAVLTVLIISCSPLVGLYYKEPRVVPLTAAMGLLILASSVGNQPGAILTRRMEFGILSLNGALGAVSGLVISIILAFILKNYWALYFGMIASTIMPVAGVWIAAQWKPSVPRRVAGLRAMLKFGAGVTSANLAGVFSGNMDNILIGRRWGDYPLGLYDRAYKLLLFPLQRISGPVMSTLVPVLSRLDADPERYRRIFLKTVAQLTLATWPGILWALILSDTLVPTLLGKQWMDSSAIFKLLAIPGLLQIVNGCSGCLLISQGRSGEYASWSIVNAVTCVASFVVGLPFGPIGVAGAYAVGECLRTPFLWWYIGRRGPIDSSSVIRAILPQIASALVSALALLGYEKFAQTRPLFFLAGGLVVSYGVTALAMSVSSAGRETLKQTLLAAQKILSHLKSTAPA